MDETHTVVDDLCESCNTIPSLRQLSNCYYTLHDTFQEFQSCSCSFCRWLSKYIDSKPQFRNDFKKIAEKNEAVELFGNMNHPKESEFLQSLTLDSGSETFMFYLFARRGELNCIYPLDVTSILSVNAGQIIQPPSIYGEDSSITPRLLMRQSP